MIRRWKLLSISVRLLWRRLSIPHRPVSLLVGAMTLLYRMLVHLPGIRHLVRWNTRRRLRRRPGHVVMVRPRPLYNRLPWNLITNVWHASAAVVILTILTGTLVADADPVGSNTQKLAQQSLKDGPEAPPQPESKSMRLSGRVAMMLQIAMLENSLTQLNSIESYTTRFEKQERIDGELLEPQILAAKIRHRPFSVYFKFEAGPIGQEILFPVSTEDQRLLVKSARLGGRLPAMKLDPNSTIVMSETRYPITMAGIKELAKMTLEVRRQDLRRSEQTVAVELRDDIRFDNRSVYAYTVDYGNPTVSPTYRRCVLYIDKQLMVPVYVRNWTWASEVEEGNPDTFDDTTLIEYYAFRKVDVSVSLKPIDFARENTEYNLR